MANNKPSLIPNSLRNASSNFPYVAESVDIYDKNSDKSQEQINAESSAKFSQMDDEIEALEEQDVVPVDSLPSVSEADPKKIYRVVGSTSYTDYMVNATGDGWKELAEFSFPGIDDEPIAGSGNLVKSGGVRASIHTLPLSSNNVTFPEQVDPDIFNYWFKEFAFEEGEKYTIVISGMSSNIIGNAFLIKLSEEGDLTTEHTVIDIYSVTKQQKDTIYVSFEYHTPYGKSPATWLNLGWKTSMVDVSSFNIDFFTGIYPYLVGVSKNDIIVTDEVPTKDSENLMTSGDIRKAIETIPIISASVEAEGSENIRYTFIPFTFEEDKEYFFHVKGISENIKGNNFQIQLSKAATLQTEDRVMLITSERINNDDLYAPFIYKTEGGTPASWIVVFWYTSDAEESSFDINLFNGECANLIGRSLVWNENNKKDIEKTNGRIDSKLYANAIQDGALDSTHSTDPDPVWSGWCVTPFISVEGVEKVLYNAGKKQVQVRLCCYDENYDYIEDGYFSADIDKTINLAAVEGVKYIKASLWNALIDYCYIKNIETGEYLWATDYVSKKKLDELSLNDIMSIPSYYKNYMAGIIDRIYTLQKEDGSHCDDFIFITDTHDLSNHLKSPKVIRHILQNTSVDKVFFAGDVAPASGNNSVLQNSAKVHISNFDNAIIPYRKLFSIRGNHDYTIAHGDETYSTFCKQAVYNWLAKQSEDAVVNNPNDPSGGYFYIDKTKQKIRYIFVDTIDRTDTEYTTGYGNYYGVTSPQLDWIGNIALKTTPDNYGIVVVSHVGLFTTIGGSGQDRRIQYLRRLLDTFINRTTVSIGGVYPDDWQGGWHQDRVDFDFSNVDNSVKMLMYLCGHEHEDNQTFADGYLSVCSICDAHYQDGKNSMLFEGYNQDNISNRSAGTIYEQSFDYVNIDKDNSVIQFIKIGAGYNRRFNIEQNTMSVGDTLQLTSVLEGQLTWGSYNGDGCYQDQSSPWSWHMVNDIVSVENGLVTSLKSGEAVVYAIDENQNKEFWYIKI